jgi:hypothetical protein
VELIMQTLRTLKSIAAAALIAGAGALTFAQTASATTVIYTNAEPTPKLQLIIDDAAAPGKFRFSLSTTIGTADYLALAFNFGGTSIAQGDISLVSATLENNTPSTPALVLYGNSTGSQNTCGNGCNFNGSGSATLFDYIIRIGENGGGSNYVKTVVFDIMASGSLAASPFSGFAVRAQSTTNPGGSIKTNLTPPAPVPLPAAGFLLLGALGGLGFVGRRRRKAA